MEIFTQSYTFFKDRIFMIIWILLVTYLSYNTFTNYNHGQQFYLLREMLGVGLCISRGTATVLNLCFALILLPMCKKLNLVLYWTLSKIWPRLFFLWLEKSKCFHITVATTLLLFAIIHSISHFFNLWNFSKSYNENLKEINYATYKNESMMTLMLSRAVLTGLAMLMILLMMGVTSARPVRRPKYNAFWYTHQLYLPLLLLLLLHPLSGVLKQEVLQGNETDHSSSQFKNETTDSTIKAKFVPIKSTTWMWLAFPLTCYFFDLIWRICSRNQASVSILEAIHMPGRTMKVTLSCPHEKFDCRMGQYVLLQCADISYLEWHPFTIVQVPTSSQRYFVVWIRVKGDWTKALESIIIERSYNLSLLIDGPFSSPIEAVRKSDIAICVAAGIGITPFVATLQDMMENPRKITPRRIHLLWIVKDDREITWVADLCNQLILQLRNANRPDRLHLEFYVTNSSRENSKTEVIKRLNKSGYQQVTYLAVLDEKGSITHKLNYKNGKMTSKKQTNEWNDYVKKKNTNKQYIIAKEYPILGCRLRQGRPHWDRVFGYWIHLYPKENLKLFCCGPKTLENDLKRKCKDVSKNVKTKFAFVHEGFS